MNKKRILVGGTITIFVLCGLGGAILYAKHVAAQLRQVAGGATFSQIVATDPAEYETYQVKFTYTGTQTKTIPTLLLHGSGRAPNVTEFLRHRTAGVHYGNDEDAVITLSVAGSTIKKLVDGLVERPPLQTAGSAESAVVSLMIERRSPPTEIVFEHLANEIRADQLLTVLEGSARAEPLSSRDVIQRFRKFTIGPH